MSFSDVDPWDWSVDEVIAHLCCDPGPLLPKYERAVNKADLETTIRDNYVTGECLIQLTDTQIENCLGIRAAGPQIHCRNSIQQLQQQSAKWMNHVSHNLVLPQAHLTQLLDRVISGGSISVNITQTPHGLLLHSSMAQSSPRGKSERVIPTLLSTQIDPKPPGQEAEVIDHHILQANDADSDTTPIYERILASNQTHYQVNLPNMRELIDSVELPYVPEHLFSRHESRSTDDETERSIKKGKRKMEKNQEPDRLVSEIPEAKMLKEFEAIQLGHWQATKLPLLELKAYQLWTEAKDKQLMQDYCLQKIEKLQHRLQGLEKEILFSAPGQDLKRMAEVLQPTVADTAAWRWKLNLYRQARQPEKPPSQVIKTPKKRKLPDSEDGIDLSSEDWDDFIDDDDDEDDHEASLDHEDSLECEDSLEDEDEFSQESPNPTEVFDEAQTIQTAQCSYTTLSGRLGALTKASRATVESLAGGSSSLIPANPLKIEASTSKEVTTAGDSSLPPYWDLDAWKKKGLGCVAGLEAHNKQECILAWNIAHSSDSWRKVSPFISAQNNSNAAWSKLSKHLRFVLQSKHLNGQPIEKTGIDDIDWPIQVAVWYMSWHCMKALRSEGLRRIHIVSALKSTENNSGRESFTRFWRALQEIKQHWMATRPKAKPKRTMS